MCGIIGGVGSGNIAPVLLDGLRRLEYRGYDSAGVAVLHPEGHVQRVRSVGKVEALAELLDEQMPSGCTGLAHTRWATHGEPRTENAHPHLSGDCIAVVHNGIVENHDSLRSFLSEQGFRFSSDTDSEVIAHLVEYHRQRGGSLREAVRKTMSELDGSFAFGVICSADPDRVIAARRGSPLVLGLTEDANYIASDTYALLPVAGRYLYLEEGDLAELTADEVLLFDEQGQSVQRTEHRIEYGGAVNDKGGYRHYMLKEIHEQPLVLEKGYAEWLDGDRVNDAAMPESAREALAACTGVHIVACGTSFHAAQVAAWWFESLGIPCAAEVASEYRYRDHVVAPGTLLVTISQSGETADTLAALRESQRYPYVAAFTICNVDNSSLVRESDYALITRAGPEIGVASTKAFTTQLAALQVLAVLAGRQAGMDSEREQQWVAAMRATPRLVQQTLELSGTIEALAPELAEKSNCLFLGRGLQYPVAREGALKLKEISYIHAEAYPAGELKHGPLALVDRTMQVVCTIPFDGLQHKTLGNLKEVEARGGHIITFSDDRVDAPGSTSCLDIPVGEVPAVAAPVVFTIPLQLLAYHVAVAKGADVDQPRNLAKSVTVE